MGFSGKYTGGDAAAGAASDDRNNWHIGERNDGITCGIIRRKIWSM